MVPIIELRGGVIYAVGSGIHPIVAIVLCVIGNMLPVPFIYLFARKVLEWGSNKKIIGKLFKFFLAKGERAGQKLTRNGSRFGLIIALILFVGIPIPGTGAWTGTLGASFLNLGIKSTAFAVSLGVILAGIIMATLTVCGLHVFGF